MVKKNSITSILRTKRIKKSDVQYIKELVTKYPFFSTGQLLLTKCLYELNSNNYDVQLKKSAAYIQNRKKLYELIMLDSLKFYHTDEEKLNNLNVKKNGLKKIKKDKYSFSEWLKISQINHLKKDKSSDIINNFIEVNPKINLDKNKKVSLDIDAEKSLSSNREIVTLTLAKVYANQGHYEKAIEAYKQLILKYPKKNSFFASQIRLIKKLKK